MGLRLNFPGSGGWAGSATLAAIKAGGAEVTAGAVGEGALRGTFFGPLFSALSNGKKGLNTYLNVTNFDVLVFITQASPTSEHGLASHRDPGKGTRQVLHHSHRSCSSCPGGRRRSRPALTVVCSPLPFSTDSLLPPQGEGGGGVFTGAPQNPHAVTLTLSAEAARLG